ncbi:MarR family winged helix-turn-helix transcriptional regulator [Planomonospora sp. ID82291]|uniref:MarR family winged helix-turn-helix transcriptional regulator n=1 Tax=Planomonospora sp. ID82291 TaxID=2738136 RepID=UPI0018C42D7D|nr:MarR family winged helix-turn-helix transcriptional regulator [Planomonospora sp. ID82291]MBG0818825.1 winged helix-turn-helix transcriptional regulator [Planomonospora sp. ID82291]
MPPLDSGPGLLGTRLRHLLDLLDADVAAVYAELGEAGFRPRFAPVLRVLAASGPCAIRDLAEAIGVTHSAASQTVAQMAGEGLVVLTPGADARRRIVRPTAKAEALLPVLEAERAATAAAAAGLEAELSFPLSRLVEEALDALDRRPMRQRIADAAPDPAAWARPGRPERAGRSAAEEAEEAEEEDRR